MTMLERLQLNAATTKNKRGTGVDPNAMPRTGTLPTELQEQEVKRGSLAPSLKPRNVPLTPDAQKTPTSGSGPIYDNPTGPLFRIAQLPTDPIALMSMRFDKERQSANRRRGLPGFAGTGLLGANPGGLMGMGSGIARKTLLGVS